MNENYTTTPSKTTENPPKDLDNTNLDNIEFLSPSEISSYFLIPLCLLIALLTSLIVLAERFIKLI